MKLSAKLKKIMWSGFRATLKFSNCEDGYESAPENLFSFAEILSLRANHSPAIKMGVTEFVLRQNIGCF